MNEGERARAEEEEEEEGLWKMAVVSQRKIAGFMHAERPY